MRPPSTRFQRHRVSRRFSSSLHSRTACTTQSPPSHRLTTSPGRSVSRVGWRPRVSPTLSGSSACLKARLMRSNILAYRRPPREEPPMREPPMPLLPVLPLLPPIPLLPDEPAPEPPGSPLEPPPLSTPLDPAPTPEEPEDLLEKLWLPFRN